MLMKTRCPIWAVGAMLAGLVGVAAAEDTPKGAEAIQLDVRVLGYDANKDGFLDGPELLTFARTVPLDDALQTYIGFLVALGGASDATIDRVVAFDVNKDGKVTKAELPPRFFVLIEKADADKDGALALAEIKEMAQDMGALSLPRDLLLELNGRGVPQTAARVLLQDADRDGKVSRAELVGPILAIFDRADADKDGSLNPAEIKVIDAEHDRTGLPREFNDLDGRSADRGGVANVERLLAFDINHDGRLTRVELLGKKHDLLDRVDANGDGVLDAAELQMWERREALVSGLQTRRGSDAPSAFEKALGSHGFSDAQTQQAIALVKTYRETVRKQPTELRARLLDQLADTLGDAAYRAFQGDVIAALKVRGGGFNGQYIPATKVVERLLTFDTDGDGRLSTAEVDAMPPRLEHVTRVQDAHHAQRRSVVTESSVDRITGFDADKDGKVTKAELPERLQALLKGGDTNRDEVLDAAELAVIANQESFDRFIQGAVGGVNVALIEGAVDDLKDGAARAKALDVLADYRQALRSSAEQARVELQSKLVGVLGAAELHALQDSLAGGESGR
ncbi:hypothetical protein EP7_002427 [Isosphaeraceae bacterium EP7]